MMGTPWSPWEPLPPFPGVILPVNPSTFGDCKGLQKFYPSDYPSEGVR
jgi:hypothetical protein